MSISLHHPFTIAGKQPLSVHPRLRHAAHHPLVVDLKGVFDKGTARALKQRIHTYLKENSGALAINFSGVTTTEPDAFLRFLKRLRGNEQRIKFVSIDTLRTDIAKAVGYAKQYFEVFGDMDGLSASLA